MFPEGKRSQTAQLQTAFPGPALIASRLGVPVLPVSITGTEKLKKLDWWPRTRITVSIGRPFQLPPADGKRTKAELYQLTGSIMSRIAGLLPPEYQGVYAEEKDNKDREGR